MTPDTKDQLRSRSFDWLMSSIVGAVLSVVLSLIIIQHGSVWQLVIIGVSMGALLGSLVYFVVFALRCQRILSRLGIVTVLKREGNKECDWPTNARFSYKYLGVSAVHVLTDECTSRLISSKRPKTLEVMYLDPTCEAALRGISEIEEREPQEAKHNIEITIRRANKLDRHNGPPQVRLVRHPLIPSIRVATVDDEIMYVGEYAPKSLGYFSDMLVLRNLENRPSLFSMFQKYYERTLDFAIYHLVSRTAVHLRTKLPSLSLEELTQKVATELHGTEAETHVTIQMVKDVLREFHLDDASVS